MRENFGFNPGHGDPALPPAEVSAEAVSESGPERRLKALAIEEINREFPSAGRDLNLISNEGSGDDSATMMLFSKPGSTFKREILYIVTVSPSGEMSASMLKPETSFEDTQKGKRYSKKGR